MEMTMQKLLRLVVSCYKPSLLLFFSNSLSLSKPLLHENLSDLLQSKECDLAKATDLVSVTIKTFEEFRSDSSWYKIFSYAEQVAEFHRITASFSQKL